MVGDDVVLKDLLELVVGDARHRPSIGVGRGVADQDVDLAEGGGRLVRQTLQVFLGGDVGGDGDGAALAVPGVDRAGDLFARPGLARGDDDAGAVLGQTLGYGLADALGRAGDDGDLAAQIKQFHA
ncbi:hypothetical protein D3C72_1034710 [compost metagenome]